MSYLEGFAAGVALTSSAYEVALADVEKQGVRRARLVKALRVKAQAELDMKFLVGISAVSAAVANVFSENAQDALSFFNASFPILLQKVGLPTKLALLETFQKITEPVGWKLCQYCGRVLEPRGNLRDQTCRPPARCRKGLQNRRAYLRRKKEIVNL